MNRLRVLIFSDDPRLSPRLGRTLRALGHELCASPALSALSSIDYRLGDIAILDCRATPSIPPLAQLPLPFVCMLPKHRHDLAEQVAHTNLGAVLLEPITRSTLQLALLTAQSYGLLAQEAADLDGRAVKNEQQLHWLQEAARAMAQCVTVDEVLGLAANHVQEGLRVDRIGITLIDEQAGYAHDWLNSDSKGRRFVHKDRLISLAVDSKVWQTRVYRELVREGKDYYYTANAWEEMPPEWRHLLDGHSKENLIVPMRAGGRLWGLISVDNLLSGRHIGPDDAPTLMAFGREVAVALGRATLQASAERRARELAILMEVSVVIASQRDPQALCRATVEQLASCFGYELVSAYLQQGDQLVLQAQVGYTFFLDPISLDKGVCARTFRLGQPQLVRDVWADPDYLEAMPDVVSELCVPILIGDRTVGLINVETRRPDVLDEQAEELLVLLARQVSVVLENAQLYGEAQHRVADLAWLAATTQHLLRCESVVDVVQRTVEGIEQGLRVDRVGVSLLDDQQLYLCDWLHTEQRVRHAEDRPFSLSLHPDSPAWLYPPLCAVLRDEKDFSLIEHAWESCPEEVRPWLYGHTDQHLLVALRTLSVDQGAQSRVLGFIRLDNLPSGRPLAPQMLPTLIAYANQVAMALERTRLLEVERRRAHLAETLERATAVIASSLDVEQIQDQVFHLVRGVISFDIAILRQFENDIAYTISSSEGVTAGGGAGKSFSVWEDPIFASWLADGRVEPELIPDTWLDARWPLLGGQSSPNAGAIRSYLAAPLLVDGTVAGALCLASYTPFAFDALSVAAAAEFAERLSHALRNARLYDLERTAHARLQAVVRLQDDFVATVSHELRTPLTSILGFAENLLSHWGMMSEARRIVVAGEFSRGKSTLINALFGIHGEIALPTGMTPTTPLACAIRVPQVGETDGATIGYRTARPALHLSLDEFRAGVRLVEEGATSSAEGSAVPLHLEEARRVEVRVTGAYLPSGVEIEDTPGLNEQSGRSAGAMSALGRADLILFVLAADQLLSDLEREVIDRLLRQGYHRNILFLVNFWENIDDESQRVILRQRVESILGGIAHPFSPPPSGEQPLADAHVYYISALQAARAQRQRKPAPEESGVPRLRLALREMLGPWSSSLLLRARVGRALRYIDLLQEAVSQAAAAAVREEGTAAGTGGKAAALNMALEAALRLLDGLPGAAQGAMSPRLALLRHKDTPGLRRVTTLLAQAGTTAASGLAPLLQDARRALTMELRATAAETALLAQNAVDLVLAQCRAAFLARGLPAPALDARVEPVALPVPLDADGRELARLLDSVAEQLETTMCARVEALRGTLIEELRAIVQASRPAPTPPPAPKQDLEWRQRRAALLSLEDDLVRLRQILLPCLER